MSSIVPNQHPAECLEISPEALEIANAYLQNPNIAKVAEDLDTTPDIVSSILGKREVKAYVDNVFFNLGFNNRHTFADLLDNIIKKKLQEMDEADVGSNKDILEILEFKHKATKELMELDIKRLALEQGKDGPKTQNNIQINGDGTKYGALLERLMKNE